MINPEDPKRIKKGHKEQMEQTEYRQQDDRLKFNHVNNPIKCEWSIQQN